MGRLAGFSADEVIRKLRRAGFVFDRQAKGSHEIWWNSKTRALYHYLGDPAYHRQQLGRLLVG
jgi:hypothetical protein